MAARTAAFEWRIGRGHAAALAAIHAVGIAAVLDVAARWPVAYALLIGVVVSGAADAVGWWRERRSIRRITLIDGGIRIDAIDYRARRAWLAPRCTAVWLIATDGHRRLWYALSDELAAVDDAALRRHVKALFG